MIFNSFYATVICISDPLGTMDTGDIVGLKCRGQPLMHQGSAVDVPGFSFSAIIAYTVWSALVFVVLIIY